MSTAFITQDVWPQLTKAARGSRQRCAVAVTYFGGGASRLLPLCRGSRLVVDASERAVSSGQTLHVRTRHEGSRRIAFVYLERPARPRRQVKVMARTMGLGALKRLRRDGVVRDAAFARALLNAWAD